MKKENTIKKFLMSIVISTIISYFIIAYYDYHTYKNNNTDFTVSTYFFSNTLEFILFRIEVMFQFIPIMIDVAPFLLILPAVYLFIFYKVYVSSKVTIVKYKLLLFTIFLVSLYLIIIFVGNLWVSF